MPPQDEPLQNTDMSSDPDATAWHPSSDPEATEGHFSPGNLGSAASGFTPGCRLNDKFELEKQLGRGGMGEAWKAFDTLAERAVVLKFVPKEIQHVKEAMDSVKESFKKVHALQHQHICPVYDLFQDERHGLCLVMKFIDGLPLDEYRRKLIEKNKNLAFSDLVQILWGVAQGLDYAHEKKVVHRDIKPQNIMVGKTDGVQIIDFGLAEEIRTSMVKFSEVQMNVAGTRPYMAPEQWQGKYQDAKTDQYALAVTAYELLSGRVPFQGSDVGILRECVLHDAPDPIPNLPDYINDALLKALAKKREDRFENCKTFVRAMSTKPKNPAVPKATDPISAVGNNAKPNVADPSLPTIHLKSEKQAGDETVWKPQISTDLTTEKGKKTGRRNSVMLFASIGLASLLTILGLIFAFSSKQGEASKKPKQTVASAPKQDENGTKTKKIAKTEPQAVEPSTVEPSTTEAPASDDPPQNPFPETMTPEEYHQFEKETVQWLHEKCNAYIQVQNKGQMKAFHTEKETPKEFDRWPHLGFWSADRHPSYAMNSNCIHCVIPDHRHGGKRCSCKLTPVELMRVNRLRKLDFLHVGGLQLAEGDLDILLPGLNLRTLQIMSIPTLSHWDPVKGLTSLKEINAFANELKPRHVEAVASLPNLQKIDFTQCNFEPGCLDALAGNESVQTLCLGRTTSLTPDDCISLSKMKALTKLDLFETPLQLRNLETLGRSGSLKKIVLKNNGLTFQEIENFRRRYPSIELDLKGQTEFPVPFDEIPAERKEIALAEVVWKSAKTMVYAPGPYLAGTRQGQYEKSLFAPAPSNLTYQPGGRWQRFESKIATVVPYSLLWHDTHRYLHMPAGGSTPSVVFVVRGDGKELYRSKLIKEANEQEISVDIAGVNTLELIVEDGGDGPRFDSAAWFQPKLKRDAAPKIDAPKTDASKTDVGVVENPPSLSDEEKKLLQQKYPEFDWTDANVVVLPKPSEDGLRAAFAKAAQTKENDFIIVRTTKDDHRIVMQNDVFEINHKANEKGAVTLIGFGPEKLILDGNKKYPIIRARSADLGFAHLVFANGYLYDENGAVNAGRGATLKIVHCDFIGNVNIPDKKRNWWSGAGGAGLCVWENSSLVLRDVLFERNSNNSPGTIEGTAPKGTPICPDSSGGLKLVGHSTLVAANVVFRNNYGGAAFIHDAKAVEMQNISLIGNQSLGGGAIHLHGGDPEQTYKIVNLFAANNKSGQFGGGLHIGGKGRILLDHLTLVQNTGDNGGGLCLGGGGDYAIDARKIELSNSIIAGNHGKHIRNFNINIGKVETLTISNSITDEHDATVRSLFQQGFSNRFLNLDELKLGELKDFGNGLPVMPLLKGSPAIDFGLPTKISPKTDITGRPRNVGLSVDIGAFECQ